MAAIISETSRRGLNLLGHGGDLGLARRLFPQAPEPFIDLSTGINPRPYPAPRASRGSRGRLPFPEELAALEAVAARAFGVDDATGVVAVAGAEMGLRLLPRLIGPAAFWVALVALTETVGGLMLAFGFLTRFAAAAIFIFMLNAIWSTGNRGGFFWAQGGLEYSLLIGIVALVFLIRGGGKYSIDHALGWEL